MKTAVNFKANLSQNLYSIRGICIVLMVIGHVIGFNRNYGMRQIYENTEIFPLIWLHNFIITFHMPIFLIASGVAFAVFSSKNTTYVKFTYSKFERLFIPLICWSSTYFIFQSLYKGKSFDFFDIIKAVIYPYEIFWFLHALIFASFFSFILFKIFKSPLLYFLSSIVLFILSLYFSKIFYIYFHWNILYAFGVFIASYLSNISSRLEKVPLNSILVLCVSCIITMILVQNLIPINNDADLSRIINGILGFFLMYMIGNSVKLILWPKPLSKILDLCENRFVYLGKISMIIYLLHGYFTRTIIFLLKFIYLPNPILYFMIVCGGGILGPIITYNFLQKRSRIFIYSLGESK